MTPTRYHRASIALHWLMAACILLMLAAGWIMTDDELLEKPLRFQVYQWHKSLGVILLWLVSLRICIRLAFKAPPLPSSMKPIERTLAHLGHLGLYALMILMPLSGWAIVSSSSYGLPTIVFGLFEWPHLPGIAGNEAAHEAAEEGHEIMALVLAGLVAGHIAAVVMHAVVEKMNLLPRMGIGKAKE